MLLPRDYSPKLKFLMAKWIQIGLPDPRTRIMAQLVRLHDFALLIGALVMAFVIVGLISVTMNKMSCRTIYAAHQIEIMWTIIPALILFALAFPSIRLLYAIDEMPSPRLTVKVVGHQWYWTYEYGDFDNISFDSYMVPTNRLERGDLRLLEVDNRIVLPVETHIRLVITGADVIHSWAVPSLGIKLDAIPGRLNQVGVYIQRPGVYRGMCSELCGVNHAYIPIVVEAISLDDFLSWATSLITEDE